MPRVVRREVPVGRDGANYVNSPPGYRAFQDILAAVGTRNANCGYVDPESLTVLTDKGDATHFDAAGIASTGQRYQSAL